MSPTAERFYAGMDTYRSLAPDAPSTNSAGDLPAATPSSNAEGWMGAVTIAGAAIQVEVAGDPKTIAVSIEAPLGDSDAEFSSVIRNIVMTGNTFSAIDLDDEQALDLIRLLAEAVDVRAAAREVRAS